MGSASTEPKEHWIASVDGRDVGWIQCAAVANWPEEAVAYSRAQMADEPESRRR